MDESQIKELQRWKNQDWLPVEEEDSDCLSESKPIVIGGCGRSGTTLLRVMLDSHSMIASGAESLLFLPTPIRLDELALKFDLGLEELAQAYDSCRCRVEFIDRFQDMYLSLRNRTIWADKTARNVHRFSYVLDHFPHAKLLHVVRDGRDVISSLRTHRKRKIVDGKILPTGFLMPWQDCIDRWLLAISDGTWHRENPRYMEVRYEDLVRDARSTLKGVCEFLEVDFEDTMLEYHTFGGPSRDYMRFPQNMEATTPIYTTAIGRWKRDLTDEERSFIEAQIRPYLDLLGYT